MRLSEQFTRPVRWAASLGTVVLLLAVAWSVRTLAAQDTEDAAPSAEQAAEGEASPEEAQPEELAEEAPAVSARSAPPPFILDPYRVRVQISFATDPAFLMGTAERVTAAVDRLLSSQFRQMWDLTTTQAAGDEYLTRRQLLRLREQDPIPGLDAEDDQQPQPDKIFLVTVGHKAGRYEVHTREWDRSSRLLGSVHVRRTFDRRVLASQMAQAIAEAFRPLAQLEVLDEDRIEFLIRAGELPPRDPDVTPFRPGDYLVPYMQLMDRNREVQQIRPIPWSYLQVEEITRSRMRLSMTSAFGAPIPASRRRVEVMAMRIRPFLPATEIKVFPRGNPRNPLVGYRCEVLDRLPEGDDEVEDRLKLSTDRRGIVTVPVDPENPVKHLIVYSGQSVLARLPFIPGNAPRLEVEVPDDRARLNVEGEVSLLQGELIDIIATREVLMARARSAADKEEWEQVDRFLEELAKLPTQEQFLDRIETLEVQAVFAARQAKDRVAERRIQQLCSGIRKSAEQHLDPFRIRDFRQDMNSLRPR
jgi:hypothetical protein